MHIGGQQCVTLVREELIRRESLAHQSGRGVFTSEKVVAKLVREGSPQQRSGQLIRIPAETPLTAVLSNLTADDATRLVREDDDERRRCSSLLMETSKHVSVNPRPPAPRKLCRNEYDDGCRRIHSGTRCLPTDVYTEGSPNARGFRLQCIDNGAGDWRRHHQDGVDVDRSTPGDHAVVWPHITSE